MKRGPQGPVRACLAGRTNTPEKPTRAPHGSASRGDCAARGPTPSNAHGASGTGRVHRRVATLQQIGLSVETGAALAHHLAEGRTTAEAAMLVGVTRYAVERLPSLCEPGPAGERHHTMEATRMHDIFGAPTEDGTSVPVGEPTVGTLNRQRDGNWTRTANWWNGSRRCAGSGSRSRRPRTRSHARVVETRRLAEAAEATTAAARLGSE